MDQPSPVLLNLFKMGETVIRPKIEQKHKKLGINLEENIISEPINSKEDVRSSGNSEIPNNK